MRNFIVAPLPPPYGGVGVAAANVRRVLEEGSGPVAVFDTSTGRQRENLYARRGLRSYWRNLVLLGGLLKTTLPLPRRGAAYHLFVTSDLAFARDILFLLALRTQGKRVIVHLHSKTSGEFFLAPSRVRLFGRLLALAHQVLVLSPRHRDFFSRYVPPAKLAVLENFVLSRDFEVGPDCRAADMLYLSRLSEMKGIWELLEAVRLVRNVHGRDDFRLTVAGTADTEETEARVRRYLDEHGLHEAVTLAGLVRGERKKELFRTKGVFVFPSRFENSPVTLKEATQAGMAVVASDIPANLNILERTGNHLAFATGSAEDLAAALLRIMDDGTLYRRLRERAREGFRFDESYARQALAAFLD